MIGQPRRAFLILGMHRSGTSAVTRLLVLAGATPPQNLMPPTDDNPQGYWESRLIARFNNRLLESAGTRWNDDAPIPPAWFAAAARAEDRAEAVAILSAEFDSSDCFVLKDPRICRLLPFWREVFTMAGVVPHGITVVRDSVEVACSLAARAGVAQFRPAAIPATSRGLLLWLRYVLDAERHSREAFPAVIHYADVIADWRRALADLFAEGLMSEPGRETAAQIDAFLDPRLRRQRSTDVPPADVSPEAVELLRQVAAELHDDSKASRDRRDQLATDFDHLQAAYQCLRHSQDPLADRDPWSERILEGLAGRMRSQPAPRARSILFLSAAPRSIGHVYRVEHAAAALASAGWRVEVVPLDDPLAVERVRGVDLVVVFRGRQGEPLAAVQTGCRAQGIPLVYDVDDLLFDPQVTAAGWIAFLDGLPPAECDRWLSEATDYRRAIEQSDAAVLTTPALAAAAAGLCDRTFVLPNALDPRMEAAATIALGTAKPSAVDGRPRLVFASGTPTHHRDFTVAARAVARVMARRAEPLLVIVGHLDPGIYPELSPYCGRIERRPPVPLDRLFAELAGCDVNLCPLELGNPFCEAKSAVRWLAAAAVGLPSIVSPTAPLCAAVIDGLTGLVAATEADWEAALDRVLDQPDLARRMGEAARIDALARFGFDFWAPHAVAVYSSIEAEFIPGCSGAQPV